MNGSLEIVLIIAAVCYVMIRRMIGEPAQGKRMLVLPAVLVVIGLSDVSKDAHNPAAIAFLAATAGVSIVLGVLRGLSVRFSDQGGVAYIHYTVLTIVLWLVNLAVKFGANLALHVADPHLASSLGNTLFLTLGAGMLLEGVVALGRALRTNSQVIWSKGKDGQPHTTSPFLDNLQSRMTGDPAAGAPSRPGETLSSVFDALRNTRTQPPRNRGDHPDAR